MPRATVGHPRTARPRETAFGDEVTDRLRVRARRAQQQPAVRYDRCRRRRERRRRRCRAGRCRRRVAASSTARGSISRGLLRREPHATEPDAQTRRDHLKTSAESVASCPCHRRSHRYRSAVRGDRRAAVQPGLRCVRVAPSGAPRWRCCRPCSRRHSRGSCDRTTSCPALRWTPCRRRRCRCEHAARRRGPCGSLRARRR